MLRTHYCHNYFCLLYIVSCRVQLEAQEILFNVTISFLVILFHVSSSLRCTVSGFFLFLIFVFLSFGGPLLSNNEFY